MELKKSKSSVFFSILLINSLITKKNYLYFTSFKEKKNSLKVKLKVARLEEV